MSDELILWRFRLTNFLNLLGRNAAEQFVTGVVLLTGFVGFVLLFYTIGQYASLSETNYQWAGLGLAFAMAAGFLTHIRPLHFQGSVLFMPISPHTMTWHNISAGLRFPLIIGAVMIIPFFLGKNSSWFYTSADFLFLVVGTIALLVAGYLSAVALALGVRTITHHSFIRLLAIVALLILGFEFLAGSNPLVAAIEQTLLTVDRTALYVMLLGSVGVSGVAVSLIELCDPLPIEHQPVRYWSILQRVRNLRATYSEVEATLVKTLLGLIRSPQLHMRLLLTLGCVVIFRSILITTVPQYPSLEIALHALALGVGAYLVTFSSGQATVATEQQQFFVPTTPAKVVAGSYLASLTAYTLFISLFLTSSPLPSILMYTVALVIGSVAFVFGRRQAQSTSVTPLTWLVLLTALPVIMALVLGTITERATLLESIIVTLTWAITYLALPLLFGSARTDTEPALQ